jgi:hypothetical protein
MSTQKLVSLKDVKSNKIQYLDLASGALYADPEGRRTIRQLTPTEVVLGDRGEPVRHPNGDLIHCSELANIAVEHYARGMAISMGRSVPFEVTRMDGSTSKMMSLRDGRVVTMDLGIADVHTAATLPNYVGGYHIADGVADIASPSILVPKATDVYYTWNATSDFNRKIPNITSPGGAVPEVNPGIANATYNTVNYALGGFLPTEVQSNADAPLRPFAKMTQIIVDGIRLEREYRVASLLTTSGNWNSNLVQTIAAGAQWDGGAAADPLYVLHKAIEQSYMEDNLRIICSTQLLHDFLRSPAIQKYFQFKDSVAGVPSAQAVADTLGLPPIYAAQMKYITGGALNYVWGSSVVLVRVPKETPPTSQMEVGTSYTMRWNGGDAPDGTVSGGLLVRTYYDQKRGGRGGTQVVVTHNDSEQMTSGLVGGLLLNVHQ